MTSDAALCMTEQKSEISDLMVIIIILRQYPKSGKSMIAFSMFN